jgi:tetratricopeptide (TPR) repeat protein
VKLLSGIAQFLRARLKSGGGAMDVFVHSAGGLKPGAPICVGPFNLTPIELPGGRKALADDEFARFWDSKAPAPSQSSLDAVFSAVGEVRIMDGGTWAGRPLGDSVLFSTSEPDEINSLSSCLRISDGPAKHCMCVGDMAFELRDRNGAIIAVIGQHHAKSLRWEQWKGDGQLGNGESLLAWLDGRGLLGPQKARQLLDQGLAASEQNQPDKAIAAYDEVVSKFGDRDETAVAEVVARALYNKAIACGKLGRPQEAIAACEEIVRRYGDRSESPLASYAAEALFDKGVTFWDLKRMDDALAAWGDVVARFGDWPETSVAAVVAKALGARARLSPPHDALAIYDDAMRRYGDRSEAAIVGVVAGLQYNQAITYQRLGRLQDALAVFDGIIARYGERQESSIVEIVAAATKMCRPAVGRRRG